jgi:hypothetical protein
MNWLDPPPPPGEEPPIIDADRPSMSTLNYWAARCTPLHDPTPGYEPQASSEAAEEMDTHKTGEIIFVACNRVGQEKGTYSHCWLRLTVRYYLCRDICCHDHVERSQPDRTGRLLEPEGGDGAVRDCDMRPRRCHSPLYVRQSLSFTLYYAPYRATGRGDCDSGTLCLSYRRLTSRFGS